MDTDVQQKTGMKSEPIQVLLVAKTAFSDQIGGILGDSLMTFCKLSTAENALDAVHLLEQPLVQVVLFDFDHVQENSLNELAKVRAARAEVPILVLTENVDEETVVEILKSGAEDFLQKSNLTRPNLLRAIRYSLERAKLIRERIQLQKLVIESGRSERERISLDLHDSVGQELTGLSMLAASLSKKLVNDHHPAADSAKEIADGLHHSLKEIRSIINGLMPVPVQAEGLRNSLNELCRQTEERTGITCEFDCSEEMLFDDNETATQIYRIAQESINNAVKHAQADRIIVRFERRADSSVLQIIDNGIGYALEKLNSEGFGLRIMSHRSALIGANLQNYSHPGSGTVVHCTVSENRLATAEGD